ncbi:MAG: hypothetical protein K6B46_05080 [Opitutales bacterium]|nr:hypothetical protein [Opitutales bacterium]
MKKYLPWLSAIFSLFVFSSVFYYFYSSYSRAEERIKKLENQYGELLQKYKKAEEDIEYYDLYIDHLLKDKEFSEMEARRHAGMAVEGEVVVGEKEGR